MLPAPDCKRSQPEAFIHRAAERTDILLGRYPETLFHKMHTAELPMTQSFQIRKQINKFQDRTLQLLHLSRPCGIFTVSEKSSVVLENLHRNVKCKGNSSSPLFSMASPLSLRKMFPISFRYGNRCDAMAGPPLRLLRIIRIFPLSTPDGIGTLSIPRPNAFLWEKHH